MSTYAEQFPGQPAPRRPAAINDRLDPRRGLPRLPIYYTIDQVASLLSLNVAKMTESYVWFRGRERGVYHARYLRAVNFNTAARRREPTAGTYPDDWRVPEGELLRWLTYNNLWIFDPLAQPEHYETSTSLREVRALQDEGRVASRMWVSEDVARAIKNKSKAPTEEDPHGGK